MNLWTKIRIWSKVALLSAVALYLIIFVFMNTGSDKQISVWVWFGKAPNAPILVYLPAAFLMGVVTTLLTRTIWRTVRQLQEMKRKRMEKEATAIITRAAKLRVREQQQEAAAAPTPPLHDAD